MTERISIIINNTRRGLLAVTRICLLLQIIVTTTHAFSAANHNSPWKAASWKLVLDIGRDAGSSNLPDDDWGQSGARLSFPVELQVESERLPDEEQDPLLGRGANRLRVVNPESSTYITTEGEQHVPVVGGGWNVRLGRKPGHASLLRFWLDLGSTSSGSPIVAQKQDVTLQAKDRLYFAAHCWRESEWRRGRQQIQPLVDAYERAQEKLVDSVSHDSGDRRLDGTDALETLQAYKDMAGLTLDRDNKRRQLQDAQEYLPPPDDLPLGNWPGSTELLAVQPMEIFVQRKKGIIVPQGEYYLIGTWDARPLQVIPEVEDEYEYYDDEEDDDEDEDYDEDEDEDYDDDEDDDEEEREEDEGIHSASETTNEDSGVSNAVNDSVDTVGDTKIPPSQ